MDGEVGKTDSRLAVILKRLFDLLASVLLLVIASPFVVAAIIGVRWKYGSPVFFRQQRPGKNGQPFEMIKLRTMREANDAQGNSLSDELRLTSFGKFLRSTSIDEFPALWNVIKGDMSLVGPRPLLVEYLPLYSDLQKRRHDVKPGITGWAQVNGRNAISWEEKFELDVWYVDNRSCWLDFNILLLTAWKVVKRKDIAAPGQATQSKFTGSPNSDSHG